MTKDTIQDISSGTASATGGTALEQNTLPHELRAELVGLCKQRAAVYGLLSRLYRVEVDQELLADLKSSSFPAETGNSSVDAGYFKIASYLSSNLDSALLDLAKDYTRTFIGHGNNAYSAAYPFESVYTSEKRLMMQEARDEVIAIYRRAGMEIDAQWTDPEDHIALEFEYMQLMCLRTAEALSEHDEDNALLSLDTQRTFHQRHLASWVPLMTADIKGIAQTDFYQGLACLTQGFLEVDGEFLNDVINQ